MPIVTLLTDFGTADGYAGELKGVLLSAVPNATVVDVSHEIAPQDVEMARLALARYWRRYPRGTVHLAVVDPGVGSARAAIAVHSEERFLVGPDNGLLSPALLIPNARVVQLPIPATASATFHGRDVFAPVAAQLLAGARFDDLGSPCAAPVIRRTPEVRRGANGELVGEVISIDRFGNAITNLLGHQARRVFVAGQEIPVRRTYSDLAPHEAGALVGSSGLLEIVVRDGRASDLLSLTRGDVIRLLNVPLRTP